MRSPLLFLAPLVFLLGAGAISAQTVPAPLQGKRVFLSPGHGYYWHPSLGWTTQRPLIDGLIEDIHTNELVMDHLLDLLEGAGAQVITCRAPSRTGEEHVIDEAQGAPAVSFTGGWSLSSFSGFAGGSYVFANASATGTSRVSFEATVATTDSYPVYVAWRAGTNRSNAVEIEIEHAGGTSVRVVDQTKDDRTWVRLGFYPLRAGEPARVHVTNRGAPGVVVADAVRIGDGPGTISRGGGVSGQPRWLEASRYWAQHCGAPPSVYDSSTGNDAADDVTCRPRYAEWRGDGDAYLSIHTNAGGGSGSSTWIYNGGATPGSTTLRSLIHNRLVTDIRAEWDPAWIDGGLQSANFGELRLLSTMPGTLVELAFHDDIGGDIEAIHHPRWRRLAARALYRGLASYLAPATPWTLEPPEAVAVRNDGSGGLTVSWRPVPGAAAYLVRTSPDGFAYDDGVVVPSTSLALSGLGHSQTRYARVATINAGGRGRFSTPVGARTAPGGAAPLLLVDGFDRRDRSLKSLQNPRDWLARTGPVAAGVATAGYPFDGATNEAITTGLVSLFAYPTVGWILGEESTRDESFSAAEQSLVSFYLTLGGRLFFSGSEVGWDLDQLGTAADRGFYEQVLGQNYLSDDAGVYATQPVFTGPLAPLPALSFDDGSMLYDVDFPDVVAPSSRQPIGQIVMRYANGASAAVLRGDGRVLGFGFPLESITDASLRQQVLGRVLELMVPLPVEATVGAPGAAIPVTLSWPQYPGASYLAACSLSVSPGLPLGDGRWFPLVQDALFDLSLQPGAPFFSGLTGNLDASGQATAQLLPPAVGGLSGFSLSFAAGVFNATTVLDVSPWIRITLP